MIASKAYYIVSEYEPDGNQSPPDQLHQSRHRSIAEARAAVRSLLGVRALRQSRTWAGSDADIEAYHLYPASHPCADGCGGYAISRIDSAR